MRKSQTRRNSNSNRKRIRKTIKKKGGKYPITPIQPTKEKISIETINDFKNFIGNVQNNDMNNYIIIQNFIELLKMNVKNYPELKDSVHRMMQRLFGVELNLPETVLASEQQSKKRRGNSTIFGTNLWDELSRENTVVNENNN